MTGQKQNWTQIYSFDIVSHQVEEWALVVVTWAREEVVPS